MKIISQMLNHLRFIMALSAAATTLLMHTVYAEDIPTPKGKQIYISDDLKTALRTGPTTSHRITAFLPSGTPLKVLSSNDEWVEVDVANADKNGWVSKLSIQAQQGAVARLERSETKVEALQSELNELKSQLSDSKQNSKSTSQELKSITDKFDRLNKEYEQLQEISKSAVQNYQTMQTTREELAKTKAQLNELQISHSILQQDNYNRGMVHALIAVIFGVIMTLIVPRLKSPSRSNKW